MYGTSTQNTECDNWTRGNDTICLSFFLCVGYDGVTVSWKWWEQEIDGYMAGLAD